MCQLKEDIFLNKPLKLPPRLGLIAQLARTSTEMAVVKCVFFLYQNINTTIINSQYIKKLTLNIKTQ